MAVDGAAKLVKYLLVFFNFIFWLCGLALIVLGVLAQFSLQNTAMVKGSFSAALVLITVGVIIFFIAFFGCCGAWKENQCMVTMFAFLLTIIIIVEIGTAIAGYVFRNKLDEVLTDRFDEMIAGYNSTGGADKMALDDLQTQLKCCGANSSADWANFSTDGKSVPDSCCIKNSTGCGKGAMHNTSIIYTNGCQPAVDDLLKKSILWIAVGALVIAFVQITGIVLSCVLRRAIRSGYEVM